MSKSTCNTNASWVRDTIVEADPLFETNNTQLYSRAYAGKIERQQAENIHIWLVRASLRRAGVSRDRAEQLALA